MVTSAVARGEVKLPAIFGDNMVLQQGRTVPVWGWAEPGEKVKVTFAGRRASARADKTGTWRVKLRIPKADGKPAELIVQGANKIVFTNVVAGEVWLCSGQSNMKAGVGETTNGKEAIANANFPQIRMFQVGMWAAPQPLTDLRGRWVECSPGTVGGFSGVGYFFGRELHQALKVPVGLIDSSAGGTAAEAWISQPVLEADPVLKALIQPDPEYFQAVDVYADYLKAQEEKRTPMPPQPKFPFRGWGNPVSSFYNAMIAPLIPYGIKGVIWYQGEARTGRFFQYERELTALINDWRSQWGQDFPFLVVQLPRITPPWNWPITRETQLKVARALPNVGLAVTIDLQDRDLHPKIKEPVGQRLALAARGIAYGEDVAYSGPLYDAMKVDGDKVRLSFKHIGGGLMAGEGGELKGFVIAGENREFVPAQAQIEGDTVVVSNTMVAAPTAVRYAFEDDPACNLFNRAGLPASPFRTDDWPIEIKK